VVTHPEAQEGGLPKELGSMWFLLFSIPAVLLVWVLPEVPIPYWQFSAAVYLGWWFAAKGIRKCLLQIELEPLKAKKRQRELEYRQVVEKVNEEKARWEAEQASKPVDLSAETLKKKAKGALGIAGLVTGAGLAAAGTGASIGGVTGGGLLAKLGFKAGEHITKTIVEDRDTVEGMGMLLEKTATKWSFKHKVSAAKKQVEAVESEIFDKDSQAGWCIKGIFWVSVVCYLFTPIPQPGTPRQTTPSVTKQVTTKAPKKLKSTPKDQSTSRKTKARDR
jgi:hypothetical protein